MFEAGDLVYVGVSLKEFRCEDFFTGLRGEWLSSMLKNTYYPATVVQLCNGIVVFRAGIDNEQTGVATLHKNELWERARIPFVGNVRVGTPCPQT